MLAHLSIRDFAIVDSLDLEFHSGFTALTGETGAGKSILIDALALALGERADADQVRPACERAEVTAEFVPAPPGPLQQWLREQALEGDPDRLLLRRVLDRSGRSRAFINGRAVTLAQLREAGEHLVDIHGQHAHQSLLRAEAQRQLLDSHAGLAPLAGEVAEAHHEWQRLEQARLQYESHAAARSAEREQLLWQVEELSRLALRPGEWDAVQVEHARLANAASLIEGVQAALESLSESEGAALGAVSGSLSRLRSLAGFDASLADPIALLESAEAQLRETAHGLRHYAGRIELDPKRLREAEERMQAIHAAARKHRVPPETLSDLLTGKRSRLQELEIASDLDALIQRERAAQARYQELARRLSAGRKKAAAKLTREVTAAMRELAMAGGRFEVALHANAGGSAAGNEAIEFLVTANAGIEPRALSRVASGGELSRISLAIQVITARAAAVPTLIFDEVDSGIGGAVAELVGNRLHSLGAERQILCVTHLPQVASRANQQWSVHKETRGGSIRSTVAVLNEDARVEEIARMLGGLAITATTRRHAAEMLGFR